MGGTMNYGAFHQWVSRKLNITRRLKTVALTYVIFLMISCNKHSCTAAAEFAKSSKSNFSKFLKNHCDLAVYKLDELSKKQAKQFSKSIELLANGQLPWELAIIIDATLQKRSSLHAQNVKRFNHGNGFVIGHQWTNIVLFFNETLIPLPPIAFYTKSYCRQHHLKYQTEHQKVIDYLKKLDLKSYIGVHNPKKVVVLADSGYDNKEIEKTIERKRWTYIIALKKKRSVKTEKQYANTPKSKGWDQVQQLFKKHRCLKWVTVFLPKNSSGKKRKEFRTRQTIGYLRDVGKAQLVCSEFAKRPKGRRKYLASNDLKAAPQKILLGYRIRWEIEIFHKMSKMVLGFEDVAPKSFESVISHVHWVYCAYILMHSHPPGMPKTMKSVADKQRLITQSVKKRELSQMLQQLSQINGAGRLKIELRKALEGHQARQILI
jgi:hypothetical protein